MIVNPTGSITVVICHLSRLAMLGRALTGKVLASTAKLNQFATGYLMHRDRKPGRNVVAFQNSHTISATPVISSRLIGPNIRESSDWR